MSIRFTSAGGLQRTANLPPWNGATICGWSSRNADRNDYSAIAAFSDATGSMSNGGMYVFTSDGDRLSGYTPTNGESLFSPTKTPANDVPFFWAMVVSGTGAGAWTLYYREELDGAFTTLSLQGAASSWTPAAIWAGHNPFGEWLDGSVEHVKCWDAALNSTELDAEFNSATPVRTTSLNFYWPCSTTSDTNDTSGNGRNPTISGTITNGAALFPFGGAVTLTCDAAAYVLTAQAVTFTEAAQDTGGFVVGSATSYVGESFVGAGEAPAGDPVLVADPATYSLSAQAVGFPRGRKVAIDPAAYVWTASSATLDYSLTASAASYVLTGQAVTLTYGGADPTIAIDPATYTLTAQAVGLRAGRRTTANPAAYALTGQAVTFRRALRRAFDPAAYTLTAQAVGVRAARRVSALPASFTLNGQPVAFRAARSLLAGPAAFVLTAQAATLTFNGADATLAADAAAFVLIAQPVGLTAARRVSVVNATYTVAAQAATFTTGGGSGGALAADPAAYVLTARDVGLRAARRMVAGAAAYGVSAQAATFRAGRGLVAGAAAYAVTAQAVAMRIARRLGAAPASYLLGVQAVTFNFVGAAFGTGRRRRGNVNAGGRGVQVNAGGRGVRVNGGGRNSRV